MLARLSLKSRLLLSFGIMAVLLGLVGGVSFIAFGEITASYGRISTVTLPNAIALGKIYEGQKDILIGISSLLGSDTSAEDLKIQTDFIEAARANFFKAKADYLAIPFEPGEKEIWEKVDTAFTPLNNLVTDLLVLSSHGDKKEFAVRDGLGRTELVKLRKTFRAAISALIGFQEKNASKLASQAQKADRVAKIVIGASTVTGFVIAAILGFVLSSSLSVTLSEISNSLASGATNVSSAAQQIAAASEQLSAAVTEQAASLEETSASIEEINAMIARNAENSQMATSGADSAKRSVSEGQSAILEVSEAMSKIQQSNESISVQTTNSGREFSEIVHLIAEISSKTKVINEIVFQTKLLSFNASVEAARAGEHGKGFAVVAEEVGNLARMSGAAAKEIAEMLQSSSTRVETIVSKNTSEITSLVEDGKLQIANGERVVQRCSQLFTAIVDAVAGVHEMSGAISVASNEQKVGVQEVTRAISQLSQVNSQNASASSQAASSAEALAAQSVDLESLVKRLAQTVRGATPEPMNVGQNVIPLQAHQGPAPASRKSFRRAA